MPCSRLQAPPLRCYKIAAFTLIELLTVIAIVAILVGILVVSLQRVNLASQKVLAVNRLRQVGVAMSLFVQEEGTLPGPMWRAQAPSYAGDSRALGYNLAVYMDLPEPDGQVHEFPYLSCPLFEANRPAKNTPSYILSERATLIDGKRVDPWGYRKGDSEEFTQPQNGIFFLSQVTEESWALKALDKGNNSNPKAGWASHLLEEPLFSGGRLHLYFSGRVEFEVIE